MWEKNITGEQKLTPATVFLPAVSQLQPLGIRKRPVQMERRRRTGRGGNYQLTVNVTAEDGEVGNWLIDLTIDLP